MNATDELRQMMNKRGVEYHTDDVRTVWTTRWEFDEHGSAMFTEYDDGEIVFVTSSHTWTPEQAIAATLGNTCETCPQMDNPDSFIRYLMKCERMCHNISDPPEGFLCSLCGWGDFAEPSHLLTTAKFTGNDSGPNHCPNCGARVEVTR